MSPWVARNLDNAQYAQARGSQYRGPRHLGNACNCDDCKMARRFDPPAYDPTPLKSRMMARKDANETGW